MNADSPTFDVPRPGHPVRGSTTGRPIMAALDLLGRRGTLRVLWELRDRRVLTFRELAGAAELPPATLNARMKELREAGLISSGKGYALTRIGEALAEAFTPLQAWSDQWAQTLEASGAAGSANEAP